jgi:TolB-like protein
LKCFHSTRIGKTLILPILLSAILLIQPSAFAETKKIAILPFEIHSQADLDYIGQGALQMLTSRLSWQDQVEVVELDRLYLSDKPVAMADMPNSMEKMKNTAAVLGADYVLSGSVTEFAGAFSVDTTVFKAATNTVETFFGQAATVEGIIPQLDILAARINHSLFDRKTAALEALEPEASTPDEEIFNIRKNPEKLMPSLLEAGDHTQDRPFWKFWGSDKPRQDKSEDAPFWKFWKKNKPDPDDGFGPYDPMEADKIEPDMGGTPEEEKEDKPFWKFW